MTVEPILKARRVDPAAGIVPIKEGIVKLLFPLWDKLMGIRIHTDPRTDMVRFLCTKELDDTAVDFANRLVNVADPTASEVGRAMVYAAYGDEEAVDFWQSDLGQLVALRGGLPRRSFTRAEAGAILAVSRQSIFLAIQNGLLRVDEDNRVQRHQMIGILGARLVKLASTDGFDILDAPMIAEYRRQQGRSRALTP